MLFVYPSNNLRPVILWSSLGLFINTEVNKAGKLLMHPLQSQCGLFDVLSTVTNNHGGPQTATLKQSVGGKDSLFYRMFPKVNSKPGDYVVYLLFPKVNSKPATHQYDESSMIP